MTNQTVGRPMEILLVEDSLMDARLTIEALRRSEVQHRLTLVRDGAEAMEFVLHEGRFARAPRPDLILLDLELPRKSGREVLSEIKDHFDLKGIPVVIMTASDDEEDRLRCQLMDVDCYITKPVNLDKFMTVVRELKRYWIKDVILPNTE
ncbi:MAG: response regulator [Pirellulaceae bacterium]|nr:response regulator [Planctomycetales bacterium]MCA9165055.1 response regulator [Planctomycetales bacterium]MCA9205526.1 response regulator [Planctomycetales bacterium]